MTILRAVLKLPLINHERHEIHERRVGSHEVSRGEVTAKGRCDGAGCTMTAVGWRKRRQRDW
jgi:hypothetical protein